MSDHVHIYEVGPRDGLQNEPGVIATEQKVALIDILTGSGVSAVEVGAFVSPRWVPQMADTADVLSTMSWAHKTPVSVLVPNMTGWAALEATGAAVTEIAIFVAASEGFSKANINCTIGESLTRAAPVVEAAEAAGIGIRGYVSCVTDCPYDGPVAPAAVAAVVAGLRDLAPMPISLGDTIGAGRPETVSAMISAVLDVAPVDALAGHFHDTGSQALANIDAALEMGLRTFDSAVAGLGGCPYAPGAPGHVPTEVVVDHLARLGLETGTDHDAIMKAAEMARAMRQAI